LAVALHAITIRFGRQEAVAVEANALLRRLATTDALTELGNRRGFEEDTKRLSAAPDGAPVSLIVMGVISVLPLKGEAFDFLGRPTFSPLIAAATATILGLVGAFAGYFPARRAASVNPAESLRYE
jgi:hypothetical protein